MAQPAFVNNLQAATQVFGSPARLQSIYVYNPTGSTAFVQGFNTNSAANVTLGTTQPDFQMRVPTSATQTGIYVSAYGNNAILFENGLCIAATTTQSGGTTAAAGIVVSMAVG